MSGHTEFWGVATEADIVTTLICNRCGKAYGCPGGYVRLAPNDSLTVTFPCCPDDGSEYIEWDTSEPVSVVTEMVDA